MLKPDVSALVSLFDAVRALPRDEQLVLASRLLQEVTKPNAKTSLRLTDTVPDGISKTKQGRGRLGSPARTITERHALYASSEWRSAYRHGLELHCYILGCDQGLKDLGAKLGAPIFKVGTALMGRLDRRVAELNRERYGSMVRAADGTVYLDEPGFDRWSPPPKLQLGLPHPLGPVRAGTTTFIVRLPMDLSPSEFESDLNRALRPASLRHYVDSDEGRAVLEHRGLDPESFLRASLDRSTGLPIAATELMLIRPQADGPALAALLEDIVINHVLGTRLRRAA